MTECKQNGSLESCLVLFRKMEEPRYFLPTEVALHNKPDDIWVSFQGKVFDITPVLANSKDESLNEYLLACAGKDITKWFDHKTEDTQKGNPLSGTTAGYTPIDSQPVNRQKRPNWLDKCREIGLLSKKPRPIRIVNTLAPSTHCSSLLWVASEEKVCDVMKRIERHNSHASSYTLKCGGRALHTMKTLDENGIPDEREKFLQIGLTDDTYIPAISLCYNDDLTRK